MRHYFLWLPWLFFIGIVISALLIVAAPATPWWGVRHDFDATKGVIRLNPNKSIEQTFTSEAPTLTAVVVWLDPQRIPDDGNLILRVSGTHSTQEVTHALSDIPGSGIAAFVLPEPLRMGPGRAGSFQLLLTETNQPVYLFFQIDSTLYRGGELTGRAGDLGFQMRYLRPPLGARWYHIGAGVLLIIAGSVVASVLRATLRQPRRITRTQRHDTVIAIVAGGVTLSWYALLLVHSGTWISPGDFVKDVAYVQASVAAVQQQAWPIWSHLTCGGLPLLANPESNTLSLATLMGLVVPPEQALLTLLALEAGIAAAGTYALARSFTVSRLGSLLAAAIAVLSPAYAYRIGEGFSMTGGTVAFTPWVLLGFFQAVVHRRRWGVLVAGGGLGLIFWRGEVHIIVAVMLLLAVWAVLELCTKRSWRTVGILGCIAAVAFILASPKLLAYGEHATLFTSHLKPYVVRLWDAGLLDDVFFTAHDRTVSVPVRYGTQETWGNFGSYTGWLPWILAGLGVLSALPYRWWLVIGAGSLLLIAEGTAFDYLLRPLGLLGVLLRLPTRILSIFLVLLGILAGRGTTILNRWRGWPMGLLAAALTAVVVVDLGLTTRHILRGSLRDRSQLHLASPATPTLAAHQNVSAASSRHPALLLKSNYLLPNLCADLNIDHPFTDNQSADYPLASSTAQLMPNGITISEPAPASDIYINENFISSWVVDHGVVMQSPTKALHVIAPPEQYEALHLQVVSGLKYSQQAILVVILLTSAGLVAALMAAVPATPRPAPDHTAS